MGSTRDELSLLAAKEESLSVSAGPKKVRRGFLLALDSEFNKNSLSHEIKQTKFEKKGTSLNRSTGHIMFLFFLATLPGVLFVCGGHVLHPESSF